MKPLEQITGAEKVVLDVLQDETYQGNNDEGEELAEIIVEALIQKGFIIINK